jgi:hypothetical protein
MMQGCGGRLGRPAPLAAQAGYRPNGSGRVCERLCGRSDHVASLPTGRLALPCLTVPAVGCLFESRSLHRELAGARVLGSRKQLEA